MTYNLSRRNFLKMIGISLILTSGCVSSHLSDKKHQKSKPNIIILFADDMGYSDIGCFGGEIETPNLDKLAANGVRFTQFYNAARCCPSRASLLTGLYPHQAGIGQMVYKNYGEGYEGNLNDRCITLGQAAGSAGYQTMMAGKWHSGHNPASKPEVRGFDHFTGIYTHVDSYWKVLEHCEVFRDKQKYLPANENPINPYNPEKEFYTTDFFTDVSLDYIDQALKNPSKPFLLHVCYNAPHFPLEAPDDLIEKYRGRYMKGWDQLRIEKLERMKQMGVINSSQKLPTVKGFKLERRKGFDFSTAVTTDDLPKWDSLSPEEKEELDFRRAMYAAQVDSLDQNIGRLIEHLKDRKILNNTLILFFSDNGCSGELGKFGLNWDKNKQSNYNTWRKNGGWSISQGLCWASYSNTPFRKYKQFIHEGGIASPFIAHWPEKTKEPGRICNNQIFHISDIMATVCDVTKATYPNVFENRNITPTPGISMVPFITEKNTETTERTLYWQHLTTAAIRQGDWKLVTANDRDENKWELYNLSIDRSETENLIAQYPDIAEKLREKWNKWAQKSNVTPYPEKRDNHKESLWPPLE